jgi:hypothetical protein
MASRTPRNFDGIQPPGKKIHEILPFLLSEISKKIEDPRDAIFQEWGSLLGEKMAKLTRPVSFLDGVLTVIVKSATLYSLLCQHERPRLLRALKQKFAIRELVFRIG